MSYIILDLYVSCVNNCIMFIVICIEIELSSHAMFTWRYREGNCSMLLSIWKLWWWCCGFFLKSAFMLFEWYILPFRETLFTYRMSNFVSFLNISYELFLFYTKTCLKLKNKYQFFVIKNTNQKMCKVQEAYVGITLI